MNPFIFLFLFSVFIASCSQILLKKSAMQEHESFIREYLNPYVIVAYLMFFAGTLITIISYKTIPLSFGLILESAGYIFVAILSYLFLKETLNKKQILGLFLILIGIVICNI
ncbi:multidrug ABC transporter [Methanobrevibacter sp. 87.7]|uniref:EamA family transporter n=1 Tax=Methanobrevibacter sp. 87.7 TaxID=387957 RepID=UPI000B50B237|nr:EamA family transporter [Methanobrevibacter sp. 87.7]OWT33637.1 multidrug ABC transporter [Methanobrevibacter sp. 87.7]